MREGVCFCDLRSLQQAATLSHQMKTIYDGLRETLISPNESDPNGEPANLVDGMYAIARALRAIARSHASATMLEHGWSYEEQIEAMTILRKIIGI